MKLYRNLKTFKSQKDADNYVEKTARKMTLEKGGKIEVLAKTRKGLPRFQVRVAIRDQEIPFPPVCTANWTEKDWEKWKRNHV